MAERRLWSAGVTRVCVAALSACLSACSSATVAPGSSPGGIAVEVRPSSARVATGGAVDFDAVVTGTLNTGVAWSVQEAGGGTVDGTGSYTAPASTGVYHVVAQSAADPMVQGLATVTVAPGFRISGTATPAASGAGATMTLGGPASATATADAGGAYAFADVADGTYTVTPAKAGFTFTPSSRTVAVSGADVAGVDFAASSFAANLTVDASRTFQTVDGMGANVNVNSWKAGELRPALDLLVDVNGASLLRVIRDPMDWVSSESDIPALHAKDAATLARIYEAPRMQDIWSTIAYLNGKGLGGGKIVLNFMGWTPVWLGGSGAFGSASYITAGKEGSFATMVASLVYYARTVKGLDFTNLAPMNEPDLDGKEGPLVSPTQYATVLEALANELSWYGLSDVRLVGPDTASAFSSYEPPILANAAASARIDHLAFHDYSGTAVSPGSPPAGKNFWLTETSQWCSTCDLNGAPSQGEWAFAKQTADVLLGDLANGMPALLIWEGFDSFYYHHNSYSTWGLLAYNTGTGLYTARKRFYVNSQLTRFIRPGAKRIALTTALSGLNKSLAFYDAASGKIAIVGHNSGSGSVAVSGQLRNLPVAVTALASYQTDSGTKDLQRGADVPVSGGNFSLTVPADTFFSLSN
jgi:O-glycosyl hydrolase